MVDRAPVDAEQVRTEVHRTLVDLFQLRPEQLEPEARLYEDLGLDSIDAIDLVAKLGEISGKKIDAERFRRVRTIRDLDDAIESLIGAGSTA